MDLTNVAAELLDGLPANRTLGLTVASAVDGEGQVNLQVREPVHNVIGALHSSGVTALADAAALAAVLSAAPDEHRARRLQPLGVECQIAFRRPVRGAARATCRLAPDVEHTLNGLYAGDTDRVRITTYATVDGDAEPMAAEGRFDWVIRLAPGSQDGV